MTGRLPFTLTPLPGEPFGLWWLTYAVRLGVTRTELAHAAGISATPRVPEATHAAAIAAAADLATEQIAGMFTTVRSCPPEHVLRVWVPQPTSRFCPSCLADGSPLQPVWSLPLTFYCLAHNRALAQCCPGCHQAQPSRIAPPTITHPPSLCSFCRHDLTADDRPHNVLGDETDANTQEFINSLLARLRDPAGTGTNREQAQDNLTDLTLIALHRQQGHISKRHGFSDQMPDTTDFTQAADLLRAEPEAGQQPLADLVTRCFRGPRSHAIPFSWRAASPTLTARIARSRDTTLTPIERIRYTTTLPTLTPQPRQPTDPAHTRAARLPDQLWPAWAIRLTDDDSLDGPVFRSAMIAALLLPHSDLQLTEITQLVPHQPSLERVAHQLRRLAATPHSRTALQILTELALALDHNDIPIDYARRRRLTTATELIDRPTWIGLCRNAGLHIGRTRRLDLARRYLYELITGGNLATAPHPYHLPEGAPRVDHVEFCATLPTTLVTALTSHAEGLLAAAGITDEPLSWHPPASWITVTDWPGADPEHTDPAPIHHALRTQWATTPHNHWAPTQAAADALGISSHHLRHVLRQHPITHAPYRQQRPGAIIATPSQKGQPGYRIEPHPHDPKRVFHVDPDWLREQYTTWGRSLIDIATEIGCRKATLRAFTEAQGIPRRPRSGGRNYIPAGTITGHPADLPALLRKALHGRHARDRIERFLLITQYSSLTQTAAHAGVGQSTLTTQLKILERECGGPLFQRRPHPQPLGPLTPLGEQLCQQARDHLKPTPNP